MYRCSFRRVHFWIWFNFGEMQSVLPSPKKTKCAATPPSGEEARAGPSRHRCCSRFAVAPPSPATKHVGRPTRQEAWVERVQRALRADGREELSAFIKESKKKKNFNDSLRRIPEARSRRLSPRANVSCAQIRGGNLDDASFGVLSF